MHADLQPVVSAKCRPARFLLNSAELLREEPVKKRRVSCVALAAPDDRSSGGSSRPRHLTGRYPSSGELENESPLARSSPAGDAALGPRLPPSDEYPAGTG